MDILTRRMRPDYNRIVLAERERFRLHGLGIKFPDRKKKVEIQIQKEVQYVDRVGEKLVEKQVPVEVVKEVPKRPVYEIKNMWESPP